MNALTFKGLGLVVTILFLVCGCSIIGCSNTAKEQELQQQKLLTELAKTNTEALAELNNKRAELHDKELELTKKDQEFRTREETLHKREREATQREREFAQNIVREEANIQKEKETFRNEQERHKRACLAAEEALSVKQADLDRRIQAIAQYEDVQRRARESAAREQEERQRPEIAERVKRHEPHLERLASSVARELPARVFEKQSRKEAQQELMDRFRNERVPEIEEDDAFAGKAQAVAHDFVTSKIQAVGEKETHAYIAVFSWASTYREKYRDAETAPMDAAVKEIVAQLDAAVEKAKVDAKADPDKAKADADRAEGYYTRGYSCTFNRQYDLAIEEFTGAIRLKPDYVKAYYGRSQVYRAKGETTKADADLVEAKKLVRKIGGE